VQDEPAIDITAVLERIGGDDDLLRELAGIYLDDETRLREETVRALSDGDADGVRRRAHTLKGAVSNFGAPAASAAAEALETAAREGRMDEAPGLLDALLVELARVRHALTPLLPGP
jgi:HPt (histidine-containing phosphotransfer) domain-containing protein